MRIGRSDGWAGFTLMELVIVLAVALAVAAVAVPSISSLLASQRAKTAARAVERELQTARLKAVTSSRAMRVLLNCPVVGQVRMVELTGVAATDNAPNRCDEIAFPFPGPSDMLRATPALDGPVVQLPDGSAISGPMLAFEFSPRGEVSSVDTTGVTTPLAADALVTVTRAGWSSGITINARGRIKVS